jgi:hypothetical protein
MQLTQTKWRDLYSGIAVLGFIAALYFIYKNSQNALTNWYWLMGLFVLVLAVIGKVMCGTWKGVFVDERNVMSLSRVQMVAWSILVLTAVLAFVLHSADTGNGSCLREATGCVPDIPHQLWLLMGFSTATLVASPVLLSNSGAAEPDQNKSEEITKGLALQGYQTSEQELTGALYKNKSPQDARWSDLITGEQNSNCLHLDLARLQMCFFTLVALLSYMVLLHGQLSLAAVFESLPELSEGLLAIVAISHGGYLVSKASQNSVTTTAPAKNSGTD